MPWQGFGHGAKTVMCRLNVNGETVVYSNRSHGVHVRLTPEESTRALQRKDKKEETRLAELLLRYIPWQLHTIVLDRARTIVDNVND